MYKLYTFFVGYSALVLPLQHFTFVLTQIVLTTMKRMLNRMLRYADAIVKRGVDKLIDAIGHSAEPQSENTETPQPQKRMGNDTDCAPQTIGNATNCGLTEQAVSLMDELCDMRYNVPDRTPEVQRCDQTDKGLVPVSKLVRNTRGMGQKFTALVMGRELVQLQVPRRRSSKGTLYYVGRKHDEGG